MAERRSGMNRRPSGIVLVLSLMGVFMFTFSMSVIGRAEGGRTLRIVDYATGLNNTKLGNETGPIPAGGWPFAVSVILDGETSDLATWQVTIGFDNNSLRCTNIMMPQDNPSYVFYGKSEVTAIDFSEGTQDGKYGYSPRVEAGSTLLNPNQAVTVSSATLCLLNFTALRHGNFTLSFIIKEGVQEETFLLDSNGNPLPTSTAGFSVALIPPIGTVCITADGSIDPPIAPISTVDNITYTFTGNINDSIVIERDNIVVDGVGYILQGLGSGNGIDLSSKSNVTCKNTNIKDFSYGILLSESSNISITGNNITDNSVTGIYLQGCSNNTISGNNVTINSDGIDIYECLNNTISGNNLSKNHNGIYIVYSYYNTILNNNMANNYFGFYLHSCSSGTFSGNSIINSNEGIYLWGLSNNRFYHNNFINNTSNVDSYGEVNVWDDGYPSGGNYWINYNGTDSNHDGIGDSNYTIDVNNNDRYPLMGMFTEFNATSEQHVQTICNSTISDFHFNGTATSFNVTGEDGTAGFCRICIPTALMNDTYRVFVNGTEVPCNVLACSNSTHGYLYFTYSHSTKEIVIVPEYASLIILPLFMTATLLAVIFYRKKHIGIRQRIVKHAPRLTSYFRFLNNITFSWLQMYSNPASISFLASSTLLAIAEQCSSPSNSTSCV
jgi:parallel beta-helix repeat protein